MALGRGKFAALPICNTLLLFKIHLKQIQLNIILYNICVMAACTGNFTLFSTFFYMLEGCHGRREEEKNKAIKKKREKINEKERRQYHILENKSETSYLLQSGGERLLRRFSQ